MVLKRSFIVYTKNTLHVHCLGLPEIQLQVNIGFTQKMVLEKPFVGTLGETLHVHCSGLQGDDTASSQNEFYSHNQLCMFIVQVYKEIHL